MGSNVSEGLTVDLTNQCHAVQLAWLTHHSHRLDRQSMKKKLLAGTHLVVDRYAYSGVAFSTAKVSNSTLLCKGGLPRRDGLNPNNTFLCWRLCFFRVST